MIFLQLHYFFVVFPNTFCSNVFVIFSVYLVIFPTFFPFELSNDLLVCSLLSPSLPDDSVDSGEFVFPELSKDSSNRRIHTNFGSPLCQLLAFFGTLNSELVHSIMEPKA